MVALTLKLKTNLLLSIGIILILFVHAVESKPHSDLMKRYRSGLIQPTDIAISEKGKLYVLDGVQHRIVVLSQDGKREFTFGGKGSGKGQLNLPMAIAIEGDRVYIADTGNHRISVFDLSGYFVTTIHLKKTADSNGLPEPVGLVIQDDVITWSDRRHHRLCQYDLIAKKNINCWGKRGESVAEFQFPFHIALDRDGYLHVVDVLNGRVQMFNRNGKYFTQISRFGLAPGELYRPNGITFGDDRHLFVSDSYRGTISVFKDGRFKGVLTEDGKTAITFQSPVGLGWHKNRLYIVDSLRNSVEVLNVSNLESNLLLEENLNSSGGKTSRKNCDICHFSWAEETHTEQKEQDGVLPVASQNMCYSCHHGAVIDSRQIIARGEQHPDVHHPKQSKKNKGQSREDEIPKQFPLLADKQLSCGSCHTPHVAGIDEAVTLYQPHNNPWLRVLNNEGDLCQKCHASKLDKILDEKQPLTGINHPVGIFLKQPPDSESKAYATSHELQKGLPEVLRKAGASLGQEQQMVCQSCHQVHGATNKALVLPEFDNEKLCAACHADLDSNDKQHARQKGIHPVNIKMDEEIELGGEKINHVTCQTCHSVHQGKKETALLTRSTKSVEKLCEACHQRQHAQDIEEANRKGVHVVNIELDKPVKINDKEVRKVTCLTCHSVHAGKADTPSLVAEHKNGELCSQCHEDKQMVVNTDHDLRITATGHANKFEQTAEQTGVCSSCHSMHQNTKAESYLFAATQLEFKGKEKIFNRDQLCLNCHHEKGSAKEALVKYFDHPAKDLVLRSKKEIMPLLAEHEKISEFGGIACITCHEPHHWAAHSKKQKQAEKGTKVENQEGNALNSFLRRKGVKGTFCVDCHGIESQIKYKYYHDKLSRDIGVDYIK